MANRSYIFAMPSSELSKSGGRSRLPPNNSSFRIRIRNVGKIGITRDKIIGILLCWTNPHIGVHRQYCFNHRAVISKRVRYCQCERAPGAGGSDIDFAGDCAAQLTPTRQPLRFSMLCVWAPNKVCGKSIAATAHNSGRNARAAIQILAISHPSQYCATSSVYAVAI